MTTCTHVAPSPGQSMCQCQHQQREMEFAAAIVERSRAETGVTIPLDCWTTPPLTGNRTRGNPYARAKEVDDAKTAAIIAIRAARIKPVERAEITLHFRPANWHRRDADGMFPTLKVAQDALVIVGALIHDDSARYVPAATCRIHEPIKGQPGALWLELREPEENQ